MAACATSATFFTVTAAQANPGAAAVPAADRQDPTAPAKVVEHDLKGPFSEQQAQQRKAALEQVLSGKKDVEQRGASKVVKLDDKKYVELGREKTDKIFTILVEFGDQVDNTTTFDPDGPGPKPAVPKYGGTPVRCTTRSRSPTARTTTAPPGARTSAATTSRTCTSVPVRARTR